MLGDRGDCPAIIVFIQTENVRRTDSVRFPESGRCTTETCLVHQSGFVNWAPQRAQIFLLEAITQKPNNKEHFLFSSSFRFLLVSMR